MKFYFSEGSIVFFLKNNKDQTFYFTPYTALCYLKTGTFYPSLQFHYSILDLYENQRDIDNAFKIERLNDEGKLYREFSQLLRT